MKLTKKILILILPVCLIISLIYLLVFRFLLAASIREQNLPPAGLSYLVLLAGLLFFGSLVYFIIDRLVIRRVKDLTKRTNNMIPVNDLCREMPESNTDEISRLTRYIDRMLKRLQEENVKREEIERMLVMNEKLVFLGRVAADISHEINTPLFAIAFSFQLLKKYLPGGNTRVNEAAQILEKEINRVRTITRNMHKFTSKDIEEAEPSDITAIIDAAVKVIKWSKKVGDTTIIYHQQDRSFPLYCNPGSLQQVFMNLIVNAVEAMKGKGELSIDVSETDQEYRIDFIDNGPGVSEEIKDEIFQPFETGRSRKGVGLGLNICHNIITNHGGTIALDDSFKKGAHFIVKVPRRGGVKNDR